jgi:hypothetical protein
MITADVSNPTRLELVKPSPLNGIGSDYLELFLFA